MNTKQEIDNLKTEINNLKVKINKLEEILLYPELYLIPRKAIKKNEKFKRYTMKDLRKAFKDAGYPVADTWLRRQINKGNLILPRSTTHFAKVNTIHSTPRKPGAVYQLTKKQIENTVKAFLPGGTGYYNYLKDKNLKDSSQ